MVGKAFSIRSPRTSRTHPRGKYGLTLFVFPKGLRNRGREGAGSTLRAEGSKGGRKLDGEKLFLSCLAFGSQAPRCNNPPPSIPLRNSLEKVLSLSLVSPRESQHKTSWRRGKGVDCRGEIDTSCPSLLPPGDRPAPRSSTLSGRLFFVAVSLKRREFDTWGRKVYREKGEENRNHPPPLCFFFSVLFPFSPWRRKVVVPKESRPLSPF